MTSQQLELLDKALIAITKAVKGMNRFMANRHFNHKSDNMQLASTFYELSKEEYNHAERIKASIEKHVTGDWKTVWDYEYEKLTEFLTQIRCMWDLFKS